MLQAGNTGTVDGGGENDSIFAGGAVGAMVLLRRQWGRLHQYGNATSGQTILGGNDSGDGADSIVAGQAADLVFGNGGNDTINRQSAETTR